MRALCLLLVGIGLIAAWPAHAEPFRPGQNFDQEQMAQLTAAALAFMAPRILEKVPVEQLAMWGLRGLTTLDPRLSPTLNEAVLRLVVMAQDGPRLLLQRPAPGDDDAAGWGLAAAQLARAAWNAAEPVRRVGTAGVVHTFFDELFNHLDPYSRYVPAEETGAADAAPGALAATVVASRHAGTLVLRIAAFAEGTAAELARAIRGNPGVARRTRPRGLVIDLRDNRGGVLAQAVATAATVLDHGLVATTEGRDPDADHLFRADGDDVADDLPLVVLVDGRTASSAEILAAALADQGRAVVVGSTTFGKGLVQTVLPLSDGGLLYVTWSRVLAPRGWPIQGLGVLPQVCTSMGEAAVHRQLAALQAGTQPMAAALARERATRPPVTPEQALDIRQTCPAAIGRDLDLETAAFLIAHPRAYETALLPAASQAVP